VSERSAQEALEKAYINFDQIRPLEPGKAGEEFHVDLKVESVKELFLDLKLQAAGNIKILFSGHRGCGKSTQLNYLAADSDIKESFLVVKYSIQDLLNPDDLDHIDLLLSMALKAYETAEQEGLQVSKELKEQAQRLANLLHGLIEEETVKETKRSGKAGVKSKVGVPSLLDFIGAQFFARYQLEFETRKKVREHFRPRLNELTDTLNTVLDEVRLSLRNKENILLLIDDIDKAPLVKSLEVFEQNGLHLAKPKCCVIYAIDMALVCSGRFRAIVNTIGKEVVLPNLRLTDVHGQLDQEAKANRELLKQIAYRRINEDLIASEALNEAILMSGGVMREFMALMAKSIKKALIAGRLRVNQDDVDRAVIDTRNGFFLRADHVKILKEVLKDPRWYPEDRVEDPQSPFLELLHTLALLEYRNGEDKWRQPHPVLRKLLERP
jgi:hypothetical protein